MFIENIRIDNFKNLKDIDFYPDKKLNVICGENAQGKTNLIEAVWLCSGVKSFRGTKDKDYINLDSNVCQIEISFKDSFRNQKINFNMARNSQKDKQVKLNGVELSSYTGLFGNLNCVVFTPEDLSLSKGSPENRRKFLDLCACQIKNSFSKVISQYDELILQRNTLLKNIALGKSKESELEIWDEQLARLGSYISVLRYTYTKKLNIFASKLYDDISNGKEKLSLYYQSTVFDRLDGRQDYNGSMAEEYLDKLKSNIKNDLKAGFTTIGVHRDDLISKINGLNSREYGSQGQNRSVALVFKIAQAYILSEERNDAPVILLDDVLSELDNKRQTFVLSQIKDMQIFITCCDAANLEKTNGRIFYIKDGRLYKNMT